MCLIGLSFLKLILPVLEQDIIHVSRRHLEKKDESEIVNLRVINYAEATQAEVSIGAAPNGLWVDIVDNGKGIVPDQRHGVRLGRMHRAIAQLGGRVSASPRPEGGTHVQAFIPCNSVG